MLQEDEQQTPGAIQLHLAHIRSRKLLHHFGVVSSPLMCQGGYGRQ